MKLINNDLLQNNAKYICHQTNCMSKKYSGLAYDLFTKFPYSNTYVKPRIRGTIDILGDGINNRFIINMNAQINPGPPGSIVGDYFTDREQYFQKCLNKIAEIQNIESIAFPYNIGCGLAKGNWNNYYKMLESFSEKIFNDQKAKAYICKI